MNPLAIFFVVFFIAFQASYLYIFTRGVQGDPLPLVLMISALFGLVSAYGEIEWTKPERRNNQTNRHQDPKK